MNISQEQVGEYLDFIENGLGMLAVERSKKLDELSSMERMEVDNIVAKFHAASNQEAYLQALAMALVRATKNQNLQLAIV